ncbi:hypothetical protein HPB50_029249 [Hyalomma asiaticum]|nr:hypothetical protein HPB50_029249 [Hyalomma asiaticum]
MRKPMRKSCAQVSVYYRPLTGKDHNDPFMCLRNITADQHDELVLIDFKAGDVVGVHRRSLSQGPGLCLVPLHRPYDQSLPHRATAY